MVVIVVGAGSTSVVQIVAARLRIAVDSPTQHGLVAHPTELAAAVALCGANRLGDTGRCGGERSGQSRCW